MKTTKPNFQACIFDFDGVIIDPEPLHAQAKQTTLDYFQIQYPSTVFADFRGRTDKASVEFVVTHLARGSATAEDMDIYKQQVYLKLFENIPLVTGLRDFLSFGRRTFKKLGVATSARPQRFFTGRAEISASTLV